MLLNSTFAFVYDKLNYPPNDLSQATTFFCYNFWKGSNLRICNSVALWTLLMAAKKQVNRFLDSICFCSHVHWQELPTTSDSANCARFSKSVTASGTSNDNSTVKFFRKVLLWNSIFMLEPHFAKWFIFQFQVRNALLFNEIKLDSEGCHKSKGLIIGPFLSVL